MSQPYRVILYHHTHWDREWWATMQDFRIRLVELIDELLDSLEADPEFRCFLLDGQTIVLKDYLEIRPENQERLLGHIRSNRIQCGPWYILPDEFLVSAESHIRNLWLGEKMAEKLGFTNQDIGYIPDTFGHISQMPQILQGFGIDNALLWRGTGGPAETFKQDFLWEAPDGSRVLTYWFPDGYYVVDFLHFDNPLKTYEETYGRVRRSLERFAARATTSNLLMPYGGDHRLTDKRMPRLIKQMNEDLNDYAQFEFGTTKAYMDAVKAADPKLEVRHGELRSFGEDLPHVLPGVLSARLYLKQLNFHGQASLEKYAEPFSALAWRAGNRYESSLLWTSWELLIQNHPHDSICGCSIDQVHREMLPRFDQSKQIAEIVTEKSVQHLNARIDTSGLADGEEAVVVHNPLAWTRTDTAWVWFPRSRGIHPRTHVLRDEEGREVPFQAEDAEGRVPMTDQWFYTNVRFTAHEVPPLGYRTYRLAVREKPQDDKMTYWNAIIPSAKFKGSERTTDLLVGAGVLENRFLKVEAQPDGSLKVTDKASGRVYEGLNVFEDGGDAGDTYNYAYPLNDMVLRSDRSARAHVSVVDNGYASATLRIDLDWELPRAITGDRLNRSADYVPFRVATYVTLASESKRIDVRTEWDNTVQDHRLRALFPLGSPAAVSHAESHFDVVERPVAIDETGHGWPETFVPQKPQQGFVSVNAVGKGLTVANKGLPEFEVLDDGRTTVALTLLRAVGWLSREDTLVRQGEPVRKARRRMPSAPDGMPWNTA
ncbi:hypothetical protein N6H14_29380 [Paenibacillus sp. CC-CFT747]|nr:hypothetical protein N6H14_29380 [Paenibacillus sp. CC-CFT747]